MTKSLTVEAIQQEKEAQKKKKGHRFQKGQVANPNGRKKGSKNKTSILRQAVLLKAEDIVLNRWEEIVETTVKMAAEGDSRALKILWDRMLPAKKAVDGSGDGKDKMNITINVSGLEVKSIDSDALDADYEEIIDNDDTQTG